VGGPSFLFFYHMKRKRKQRREFLQETRAWSGTRKQVQCNEIHAKSAGVEDSILLDTFVSSGEIAIAFFAY